LASQRTDAQPGSQARNRQKKDRLAGDNPSPDKESPATDGGAFRKLPASPIDKSSTALALTDAERNQLLAWARTRTSPHRLVVRSRVILLADTGLSIRAIATRLSVSPATVRLWRDRFARSGLPALARDRPGRGRPPGMSSATVMAVLEAMRSHGHETRAWTTRTLATVARTSHATVWRIWQRYGLGPTATSCEISRAIAQAISETAVTPGLRSGSCKAPIIR
jgi:transposase